MKKIILLLFAFSLLSCGSYNSINSFYNAHKNDPQVTAIQVPQYLLSLLRHSSGEMNSFMGNVRDIRYIQLSPQTDIEANRISNEINSLVSKNFVDVYRKNNDDIRTLISLREKKDVVKEIIIYKNGAKSNSVFYLNGNFNPQQVRKYVDEGKFDNLTNSVFQQMNINPEVKEKEDKN
ncbi:DUF4252 domain-containing protein [Aureibaculum sp. 2210JD6-5]|uniref:DUF4252 domain-containing protein n=1 Tax=Aureibaculum sp. 2210JD6-5 TaxID=3103957 RepID=UPI002AAEE1F1|nr:DUF4252 domain-containing protein [Aureibaculum sp. 2210JD6-5]MDY7394560.1 DUF4252 domain-containing protein [Aureibaculum sp. 2210JD6-5]